MVQKKLFNIYINTKVFFRKYGCVKFLEFAIENFIEMIGYIVMGNLIIKIHKDITGLPDG